MYNWKCVIGSDNVLNLIFCNGSQQTMAKTEKSRNSSMSIVSKRFEGKYQKKLLKEMKAAAP